MERTHRESSSPGMKASTSQNSIDMSANLDQERVKEQERQRKLLQPISRQNEIKNTKSFTNISESREKESNSCIIQFNTKNLRNKGQLSFSNFSNAVPGKSRKYDYVQNKVSSRRDKSKNVLAYSLLDKSLDNTIQMLESARKQELKEMGKKTRNFINRSKRQGRQGL